MLPFDQNYIWQEPKLCVVVIYTFLYCRGKNALLKTCKAKLNYSVPSKWEFIFLEWYKL